MQIFVDGNKYVMKHREWCWITRNFFTYMMRTSAVLAGAREEVVVKVVFKPTGENVIKSLVLDKDYVKGKIGRRSGWQVVDTDPYSYSYMWWAYKFFHEKYLAHREATAAADHERAAHATAVLWWKSLVKLSEDRVANQAQTIADLYARAKSIEYDKSISEKVLRQQKTDKARLIAEKAAEIKKANGWE